MHQKGNVDLATFENDFLKVDFPNCELDNFENCYFVKEISRRQKLFLIESFLTNRKLVMLNSLL